MTEAKAQNDNAMVVFRIQKLGNESKKQQSNEMRNQSDDRTMQKSVRTRRSNVLIAIRVATRDRPLFSANQNKKPDARCYTCVARKKQKDQ